MFYRGRGDPGISRAALYLTPQGLRVHNTSVSYPAFPAMLLTHLPLSPPPPPPPGKFLCGPTAYQSLPFIPAELAISQSPVFFPPLSSRVTASHPTTREVTARAIQPHHLHLHHHLPTTMGATAATPRPLIPHHHPLLHRPTLSQPITSISR